jgi:hypothetical protein
LALAGVARLAEIAADIGTARSRLDQRQSRQQRGPFQYFNSLLGLKSSPRIVFIVILATQ